MDVIALITKHEGCVLKMYNDSLGIPTIGVGHNLRDKPISQQAANQILNDDLEEVVQHLRGYPWFSSQNDVRQAVLIDMAFNMGVAGLLKFEGMLAALESGNFGKAADEMLDSVWAREVGPRAVEDSGLMRSGTWT